MDTLLLSEITRNITIALREDQIDRDVTTLSCFPRPSQAKAKLILKEDAILAGLIFLPMMCLNVDSAITLQVHAEDGSKGEKGDLLATLEGSVHSLLAVERTLINFIQHATSIATQTNVYVQKIKDLSCDILDTRKTLPCHRFLQKYATRLGGAKNHRFHLADQILIKDNHLTHMKKESDSPIEEAIKRGRKKYPSKRLQIEVATLEELSIAAAAKPDAILLDNMTPLEIKSAVEACPQGIYLEASGGIDLTTIRSYAETGIHGVSIGRLTHSIHAVDMSLKL